MPVPFWVAEKRRWPLVVVHLVGGDGKKQPDFDSFMRVMNDLVTTRDRIVLVHDLTHSVPDAVRRRQFVEWYKANAAAIDAQLVGYALVAPTAFHRGVIVATTWLFQPRVPLSVFANVSDAKAWALAKGDAAGLRIPTI